MKGPIYVCLVGNCKQTLWWQGKTCRGRLDGENIGAMGRNIGQFQERKEGRMKSRKKEREKQRDKEKERNNDRERKREKKKARKT